MKELKFSKELYPKQALIKAAYNFTDKAYVHLDADEQYFYVSMTEKEGQSICEDSFVNEMLAQSVRHEIYLQTKNIRELLMARALATCVVMEESDTDDMGEMLYQEEQFDEEEILKDWFVLDEKDNV